MIDGPAKEFPAVGHLEIKRPECRTRNSVTPHSVAWHVVFGDFSERELRIRADRTLPAEL
jgi:hypothetical protein